MENASTPTGSIWKCLIFWWWHNVSTKALGLLWLTRSRNKLENKNIETFQRVKWKPPRMLFLQLPIDLTLLVDNAMGFFSGYSAMEPQLGHVDDWRWDLWMWNWRHNSNYKSNVKTLNVHRCVQLYIHLSLVRSGAMDCGSLKCSFGDSSSESDVTKK